MNSWVRYSVAVYVGLLLAGSVVVPPTLTAGFSNTPVEEAPPAWVPGDWLAAPGMPHVGPGALAPRWQRLEADGADRPRWHPLSEAPRASAGRVPGAAAGDERLHGAIRSHGALP